MNGSRGYLTTAQKNYPELCPVLIEVAPEVLKERLARRGRETRQDIELRLNRNSQFDLDAEKGCLRVDNTHSPEVASQQLLAIIDRYRRQGRCA
jgi:ribose 1,5-bisphosphokinase